MGRRSSAVRKSRFTLFLPDDTIEELVKQQEASGKGSIAEVVREAVDIYVSLIRARDEGVTLFFEDNKTAEKGRIWLLPGPVPTRRKKG